MRPAYLEFGLAFVESFRFPVQFLSQVVGLLARGFHLLRQGGGLLFQFLRCLVERALQIRHQRLRRGTSLSNRKHATNNGLRLSE